MVPRSGWSRISTAGMPAITSIADHVEAADRASPTDRSVRSATTSAMPMTTASLANSAGWIDMPADHAARSASR